MKKMLLIATAFAVLGAWAKSATAEKIAVQCPKAKVDRWCGGERSIFEFRGCETWVVEPASPAAGNPWAWIMEWPGAFADRTGAPALLAAGYRVVTFRPGSYDASGRFVHTAGNMNDARVRECREFQRFLVEKLGFAPKGNLIGMSWGGYYSIRYASVHPDCVAHIYLDAPLLDFSTLQNWAGWNVARFYGVDAKTYVGKDDPLQPVNRAAPIAKAGIPILLLYGGADQVVPPAVNCELFAKRFQACGGKIKIQKRGAYGHHPHGLELNEQQQFVDFFNGK